MSKFSHRRLQLKKYFYFLCMGVLPEYLCVTASLLPHGGQRDRRLDPLELGVIFGYKLSYGVEN